MKFVGFFSCALPLLCVATAPDTTKLIQAITPCYQNIATDMGQCYTLFTPLASPSTNPTAPYGGMNQVLERLCVDPCLPSMKAAYQKAGDCVAQAMLNVTIDATTKTILSTMGGTMSRTLDFMCTKDPAKNLFCFNLLTDFYTSIGKGDCNVLASTNCCYGSLLAYLYSSSSPAVSNMMTNVCPNTAFSDPCLASGKTAQVLTATFRAANLKLDALSAADLANVTQALRAQLATSLGCPAKDIEIGDIKALATVGVRVVVRNHPEVQARLTSSVALTTIPEAAKVNQSASVTASGTEVKLEAIVGPGVTAASTSYASKMALSVFSFFALVFASMANL